MLGLEWIKHFYAYTVKQAKETVSITYWRWDGYDSHVNIDFIEFYLTTNIIVYYLPSNSIHLPQSLDVALYSTFQKYSGKHVDQITQFRNISVTKVNFLPILVEA